MKETPFPASAVGDIASHRIVHLVPPNGGGVDRLVRDLCSQRPADWLLHVSEEQWVVECLSEGLLIPVAVGEVTGLLARSALGRAAGLHVHSTIAPVRRATGLLTASMRLPYVVTLHDVEFAGPSGSIDIADNLQRRDFILAAARCTVPSEFLRCLAREVIGDNFDCEVVTNGVDRQPSLAGAGAGALGLERFPIAVIGALGQHKGLAHLLEVAAHLPAHMRVALLGYADGQLGEGSLADGRIHVHGPFEPERLPDLVRHYGASIAFFPRGQPESYCYALSDAWLAGLPVLGPDWGAIGERVRANGGGGLYDPQAPAADVALMLASQCEAAQRGRINIDRAIASLVSVAAMVETMNKIYAGVVAEATPPDLDALKLAASAHLDSRFFRKELLRLQGDLVSAGEQRDNALHELSTLAANFEKRGEWIEHLQRGQDEVRQACEDLRGQRAELQQELDEVRAQSWTLDSDLAAMKAAHAALQAAHAALQAAYDDTLGRRLMLALWRVLPPSWQARLKELGKRGSLGEDKNG